ncbi:unnamed protein product [Gongylonema pulchrum]|uniref:Uncharacterized protein n=1 Tax=Gongylonema pulchrum TaxID=637853 RepID=A0A183E746_9BILA|nr:unnamed protein product [Gongylonema pulchrum]
MIVFLIRFFRALAIFYLLVTEVNRGMTMINQTGASGAQPSPEPTSLRTTHFRPAEYPRGERLTVQPSVRRVPIGGGTPSDQFAGTSAQQTSNEYRLLAEPELSPVVAASAGNGSQIASVSRPAVTIQPRQGMSTVVHPVLEPQSLSREGFGGPESRRCAGSGVTGDGSCSGCQQRKKVVLAKMLGFSLLDHVDDQALRQIGRGFPATHRQPSMARGGEALTGYGQQYVQEQSELERAERCIEFQVIIFCRVLKSTSSTWPQQISSRSPPRIEGIPRTQRSDLFSGKQNGDGSSRSQSIFDFSSGGHQKSKIPTGKDLPKYL